jgi:4-aminobutyrate---pyruvate transaminase
MPDDTAANYQNDTLVLGISDLKRLRRERPLVLAKGRGIYVFDENGRDYIEAVSSFYCVGLGYSEPELVDAAIEQLRLLPMYPSGAHRTVPVVLELAEKLSKLAPFPKARVTFATTGSEANDHVLKFLWFANAAAGQPQRRKIVTRKGSYHGSTVATTAMGGGPRLHALFGIPTGDMLHVSQTVPLPNETEAETCDRLVAEFVACIEAADPSTIAAFYAEPLSVSAGMRPPPADYFARIGQVCDAHGIRLVADEVVTGFGRLGTFWGSEAVGAKPALVTAAKNLSSAYQPIAAIIMGEEFADALEHASDMEGWLPHNGTYHAHPVAAAVALKTLEIIERRDLVGHVRRLLPHWQKSLSRLEGHPLVRGVRSYGLLAGIDLNDPVLEGGAATGPATSLRVEGIAQHVYDAALDCGVVVRPLVGSLVLSPPLVITEAEIDELVARLARALDLVARR